VSISLSVCKEQLGFHQADSHEMLHLNTFRKSVQKFEDQLKSDNIKCILREDLINFLLYLI